MGIDLAIQVHNRVEEEVLRDHVDDPLAETSANMGPPVFVAVFTGVLAFAALRISKVPMIRDFGVLLAAGVVMLGVTGIVVTLLGLAQAKQRPTRSEASGRPLIERAAVWLGSLPTWVAPPLALLSAALFIAGVAAEGGITIESDPIRWIDQDSQVVQDVERLEEETGFSSTLGVLVEANNVTDQAVIDLVHDFTITAEADPDVATTSSLTNTMAKIIEIPGATALAPTSVDEQNAIEVMPPDIRAALLSDDLTATQVNLRLAPATLDERAVLVERLNAELAAGIAALDLPPDSVLLVDLPPGQPPVRAVPAGLATVGIGLLENLEANRAVLTYLALAVAALWLVLRSAEHRSGRAGARSRVAGDRGRGAGRRPRRTRAEPADDGERPARDRRRRRVLGPAAVAVRRGAPDAGSTPEEAHETSSARTGRAFFTSAATTIGGFAVLVASSLPLLRDFGIIVTLNVAIALLAALVVVPPAARVGRPAGLAGGRGAARVRCASPRRPPMAGSSLASLGAAAVLGAATVVIYQSADTSSGEAEEVAYAAMPLPTTTTTTPATTTTTTTPPGVEPAPSAGWPGGRPVDVRERAAGVRRRWRAVRPPDRAGCGAERRQLRDHDRLRGGRRERLDRDGSRHTRAGAGRRGHARCAQVRDLPGDRRRRDRGPALGRLNGERSDGTGLVTRRQQQGDRRPARAIRSDSPARSRRRGRATRRPCADQ